jgi:hypothetical protein
MRIRPGGECAASAFVHRTFHIYMEFTAQSLGNMFRYCITVGTSLT